MRALSVAFFALFVSAVSFASAGNAFRLNVRFDPSANEIGGWAVLTVANESPIPWAEIPLALDGGRIIQIRGTGGEALPSRPGREENTTLVVFPSPLPPGGTFVLEVEFRGAFPLDGAGYRLVNGAWHPKLLVFREGEFRTEERQPASYDVTITLPKAEVVVASGRLLEEDFLEGGMKRLRFAAKDITDFGIASSPDFRETTGEAEGVVVRAVSLPGREAWPAKLAGYAARAIGFYRELFGFYPQDVLSILPGSKTSVGGYPAASSVIVIHDTLDGREDSFAEWIVAHEIGHQYWGWDGVLDEGRFYHWPGLGLGILADRLYCEKFNPEGTGRHRSFVEDYLSGVGRGLDTTILRNRDQIDALPFDFNNIVAHGKSYAVIRMLEALVGRERFPSFLRTLQERYRGRVLSPADFEREAEAAAGSSLDWFFRDWVEGNAVLSYGIESVERTKAGVEVVVRRTGSAGMPLDVELVLDGGRILRRAIDRRPEVQTLVFEADGKPRIARIDPDRSSALYSPEGNHIWAYRPSLVEVRLPDQAAWGTNVCAVTIRNDDDLPHEVIIHAQTRNLTMPRGWGYQEVRSIPAGKEITVPKPFILPPWPGRARLRLTLSDFTGERRLLAKDYFFDFPFVNSATAPLVLAEDLRRVLGTERAEWPRLLAADRGRFVVYYLEGDAYVEKLLPEILREREKAYAELAAKINPGFDARVAVYLLPDQDSKRVYFGHVGLGWAPGNNCLVEVFNAKERLDPYHELVHIIAGSVGNPPALLNEGLAVFFQAGGKWDGCHFDAWSRSFDRAGMLFPLDVLFDFREIGSQASKPGVAYPQAASVVSFLAARHGFSKVMDLFKALSNGSDESARKSNRLKLADIIGRDVEGLEKAWLDHLRKLEVEPVPKEKVDEVRRKYF